MVAAQLLTAKIKQTSNTCTQQMYITGANRHQHISSTLLSTFDKEFYGNGYYDVIVMVADLTSIHIAASPSSARSICKQCACLWITAHRVTVLSQG